MFYFLTNCKESFCKTAACALGSAALHPWFNEQGLTIDGFNDPTYKGLKDFDAAAKFFALTSWMSCALFSYNAFSLNDEGKRIADYDAVKTPEQMAKRLYRFLEEHYDMQTEYEIGRDY